jgi:DNA-binding NarL/FixJ family response regulator
MLSSLTPRETEVLRCLVDGKSNKGIANDLGISPFTVRDHVTNLMNKLGARNRVELVSITSFTHVSSHSKHPTSVGL